MRLMLPFYKGQSWGNILILLSETESVQLIRRVPILYQFTLQCSCSAISRRPHRRHYEFNIVWRLHPSYSCWFQGISGKKGILDEDNLS